MTDARGVMESRFASSHSLRELDDEMSRTLSQETQCKRKRLILRRPPRRDMGDSVRTLDERRGLTSRRWQSACQMGAPTPVETQYAPVGNAYDHQSANRSKTGRSSHRIKRLL
jgi:hypothetical protein